MGLCLASFHCVTVRTGSAGKVWMLWAENFPYCQYLKIQEKGSCNCSAPCLLVTFHGVRNSCMHVFSLLLNMAHQCKTQFLTNSLHQMAN